MEKTKKKRERKVILDLPREGWALSEQVRYAMGWSKGTLYNRIKAGKFPRPQKDGSLSKWPVDVVRQYLPTVSSPAAGPDNQPTPAS